MKRLFIFLPIAMCIATLTGCVAAIGNRDQGLNRGNVTLGQQLIDLKKAKEAGALSDEEYQEQRARVLKK
jgi:hypothetical protein